MRIVGLLLKVFWLVASLLILMEARVTFRDTLRQKGQALDWTQQAILWGILSVYFALLLLWIVRPFLRKK